MKRILIPINFTEKSKLNTDFVINWIKDIPSAYDICLVHGFLVNETNPAYALVQNDQMKKESLMLLDHECKRIKDNCQNSMISFKTYSQMGSIENIIGYILDSEHIDLVVLGKDSDAHTEAIMKILVLEGCPVLLNFT